MIELTDTSDTTEQIGILPYVTSSKRNSLQGAEERYPQRDFDLTVPFSDFISQAPPSQIDIDYLTAGLAATFTTNIDNPIFAIPTKQDERDGALPAAFAMYAPYYIGTGLTAKQIAIDVAGQAASYVQRLEAEHGYDGYTGRMLSVLRRGHVALRGLQGIEDRNILFDIHDFMASISNRLHHLASFAATPATPATPLTTVGGRPYSAAEAYRDETHSEVDPYVQTLVYQVAPTGYAYKERFELPQFIRSDQAQLVALGWDFFDTKALRRGAEFAALAAEKVGDPLVRAALSEHYMPSHMRRRAYMLAAR